MPALTVSDIKHAIVSDDGTATSVTFTTKYVGDLDVTMPSSCVDRLIAVLQDAKSKLQPKASPQLEAQPKASLEPAASLQPSPSYSGGMHFELTGMAQSVEPA